MTSGLVDRAALVLLAAGFVAAVTGCGERVVVVEREPTTTTTTLPLCGPGWPDADGDGKADCHTPTAPPAPSSTVSG